MMTMNKKNLFIFLCFISCVSVGNLDAYGFQLLPAGFVCDTDHKMIVSVVDVVRNWNVDFRLIRRRPCRDGKVLVVDPRINRRFYGVERTVAGGCGMRVVVEIVVDFEVEVAELHIVGECVAERNCLSFVMHLAVYRGRNVAINDLWLFKIFCRIVVVAA